MLVTVFVLVGVVRSGGSFAPDERPAHGLASTDAAGAPDPTPDLDTGGEATLPGAATMTLPHLVADEVLAPAPPRFVGRLHAVRLFRPPRLATFA
jgi:hypothetical protein